jgi:hypothetical protein
MRKLIRPVAVAGSLLAAVTTLGGVAGPASAATAPSGRAADWLVGQLDNGVVHNDQYDFDDYGLTADVALALADLGGHRPAVRHASGALAHHVKDYIQYGTDEYAGATAKAAVVARVAHKDPRSFGGVDLVSRLATLVSPAGRIHDQGSADYANVIGQAYAVSALSNAHSVKAGKATRFLLEQQCGRGFFRLNFSDPSASDQSCSGAARSLRAPDTDVTALAGLMLRTVDHPRPAVRHAIAHAVTWLKRHQAKDGSFGGGTSTTASNSNSTGLAAWALGEGGSCRAARRAATWVAGLQVTSKQSGTQLRRQVGAIAYDRAAFRTGRRHGITAETQDQWRRASAQAAPGLLYLKASACS